MSQKKKSKLEEFAYLGVTLQRLRKAAGYSLGELSDESGVAKSIISRIEKNETNPTLNTIWRLSQALNTSMEDVLKDLDATPTLIAHHKPNQIPTLTSQDGLCTLRITGYIEAVTWVQVYEFYAEPGGQLISDPHPKGSIENLSIYQGQVRVHVGHESFEAGPGEVLRYRGDLPHKIENIGEEQVYAHMVNLLR